MSYPEDRLYTKDHEWLKKDGDLLLVGITHHAQDALGDVVFVELPEIGRKLKQGEAFGVVESIKAVSDLFSPIDGEVTSINSSAVDQPGTLNETPHDSWLIKIKSNTDAHSLQLMNAKKYSEYVKGL